MKNLRTDLASIVTAFALVAFALNGCGEEATEPNAEGDGGSPVLARGGPKKDGPKVVTVAFTGDVTAAEQAVPGSNTNREISVKGRERGEQYTLKLSLHPGDISSDTCEDENGDPASSADLATLTGAQGKDLSGRLEFSVDKTDPSNASFAFYTSGIDGTEDLVTIRNPGPDGTVTVAEEESFTTVAVTGLIFRWFRDGPADLVRCPGVGDYSATVSK